MTPKYPRNSEQAAEEINERVLAKTEQYHAQLIVDEHPERDADDILAQVEDYQDGLLFQAVQEEPPADRADVAELLGVEL